ncbi:TetR/AcrR family transcriptional regulator [Shinella sp. NM-101]|uniref:TetR/AcrR family transcriptional regulator n=1 Tax=Shinella sp. NM-101 TaxID=2744455 RepID=UPI001F2CD2A6|nr:TetR/AcrR family transcriptional regulator [Shinella sp. NM-101]
MKKSDATPDHRSRTAERRRDAMRRRLVESAMAVFAEKGAEAAVIDDVIRAADVSRGTFYKYFSSTRDLSVAISQELADELAGYVEQVVLAIPDPARRVAFGLRLFIETARAFPLFAGFIRATGLEATGPASLINDYLPRHLSEGAAQGRFVDEPVEVLLDLIVGAVLLCVLRQVEHPIGTAHVRQVVASILRGLGLPADEAWKIADIDVPPLALPADSLLMRAHLRLSSLQGRL